MCGIAGILSLNSEPASPVILRRMTDAIAHRGPDGEGHYIDGVAGLGHRRLAIIDLSPAGHQPMLTRDRRYALTYNGEIYNFQELRVELESLGYQFRSRTDSEVLLYALAEWGEQALDRLNGMFAFALWDARERRLMLARDRYGVKPLYYAWCGKSFVFGSEVKALLAHPDFPTDLDKEGLLEYFTFQNFFTDRTLFKGVRLLPGGCHLTVLADGASPALRRYWDFHFEERATRRNAEDYARELDHLFLQAVSRQLVSDVDIGAYLSGGMDSGSITAVAARQIPDLKTFTVGFDLHSASGLEMSFDEREKAEHMSYLFRTEHYEMVLKAGDMERVMKRLVRQLDEPRVGQSYPNFYAAQLAAKFVKVVLSGAGGDELFAGYPWRYYRAATSTSFDHYIDQYYAYWQRLLDDTQARAVFAPLWPEIGHVSTRDIFRGVFNGKMPAPRTPEEYINHSLYFEAKTFLNGLLTVEDKMSMAHGLETRVPFLDNDLVDFAMRIPVRLKLANLDNAPRISENEPGDKAAAYFAATSDGKLLLRRVMNAHVPTEVAGRVKQGFSAPDASWFKGDSIDYVRRRLLNRNARIYDVMAPTAVASLIEDHIQGRHNRRLLIWSLLNLEYWLDIHLP
jgi:asparagine synthase (glutamine-hydrolysing)